MAHIRPMIPADYPVAAALADDAIRRGLVGRPSWESEDDVAAELATQGPSAFIAALRDDGTVVGLAGYRLKADGEAELFGPLVQEEGHGIGAWLSSRIEALARQRGATAYSMLIGLRNGSGAAWAQWRGYQPNTEHPESVLTWVYPGELKPVNTATQGQIRPAGPADLERIHTLYQDCFPLWRRSLAEWGQLLTQCHVLTLDEQVAGFLRLDEGTGWVHDLCVDRPLRRRGLGAQLLSGVVEQFWQTRSLKVGLVVPLDSEAPLALFRRMGFRREVAVAKWMKREG
jgi:GNAT superfamily N-acetyltransferase